MSFLENIRKKPYEQKVRIIWVAVSVVAVLMAALWITTSKISRTTSPDTTLFKTIGRGIHDIKENYKK